MFNQTAAQRGVKVDYSAEFSGPSHAGQWTVQCIGMCCYLLCTRGRTSWRDVDLTCNVDLVYAVNGIRKGEGKGSSKQIAKEEAARQAYYSMGWS